ncbi:MAG: hypothetical protein ACI39R_03030 [Lachnospiraceae bacterium]
MATERKYRNTYNYDNLARKYSVEEEKRQERLEQIYKKTERNSRNNEQAATHLHSGIDFVSVVVLSLALVCLATFGLQYLVVSSQITEVKKEVSALNSSYKELKSMNDEAYNAIDNSVDIGHVYEVAVGELGMVFPDENQIVTYDYQEEGYVRQYTTVPEE